MACIATVSFFVNSIPIPDWRQVTLRRRVPAVQPLARKTSYRDRKRRITACVENVPFWKVVDSDVAAVPKLVELEKELDDAWYAEDEQRMGLIQNEIDKLQASTYVDVLQANLRFYKAFSSGNVTDIASCWLQKGDVLCKHPLGPIFVGFWQVVQSFETLMNQGLASVRPDNVRISVRGLVAFVTCEEYAEPVSTEDESISAIATKYNPNFSSEPAQIRMTAVNIFEKQNGQYYLVYHMSSPISPELD